MVNSPLVRPYLLGGGVALGGGTLGSHIRKMHSPTQHENLRNTINGPQNKLSNEKNLGWLGYRDSNKPLGSLLLMAEILHHLGCMTPYK